MKFAITIFLAVILTAGCQRKPEAATVTETVVEEPVSMTSGECYLVVIGKDSIIMQIDVENNSVTGHLHYRFQEKDKSGGTLFGNLRGDTLIADYKFMSEGMESEREVAFLKSGEGFVEGYGDIEEQGSRMVFKDIRTLKFDGQQMQRADCEALEWYFRKK
jgi:hypothetical protein